MVSSIEADQSRCLRMRFNKNKCRKCLEVCSAQAIKIDEQGLTINQNDCTECMLCASTCSTDALRIRRFDFLSIMEELKNIQEPVIGCGKAEDLKTHLKTVCLGFISEIHFAVMSFLLEKPVQLNLIACKNCVNGFIVSNLQKKLDNITKILSKNYFIDIRLIENVSELTYRPVSYTRRDFFKALRSQALQKPISLLNSMEEEKNRLTYTDKAIPGAMSMLNRLIHEAPAALKRTVLESYYFDAEVNENCDMCFACIGMCPTGALKTGENEKKRRLIFNSSLCNGCGLCVEFCWKNAVDITRGYSGNNPYQYRICES